MDLSISFDDCLGIIGNNLNPDNLLPLSLVNKKYKEIFFKRFEKINIKYYTVYFEQVIVSLKIQSYLLKYSTCEVYLPVVGNSNLNIGKKLIIRDLIETKITKGSK